MNTLNNDKITMAHGSGGADSVALMQGIFAKHFGNEILGRLEDSAVVDIGADVSRIAVSTDSFVVTPIVFPGGDIGKLAVTGAVNDILMSGATPRFLTCGFIIEAGLSTLLLDKICASLAAAATEAGVLIVAGDTKVIEGHSEDGGLMINTTGIGVFLNKADSSANGDRLKPSRCGDRDDAGLREIRSLPCPSGIRPGDSIIVSGNLGDHHAAILSARMGVQNDIKSDCALLTPIIQTLRNADISIHAMRDVTRGGLGTVLNELATASGVSIVLEEAKIPVDPTVRAFCSLMGLDPLYMGNEGKVVLAVAPEDAVRALAQIRNTEIGRNATIIGATDSTVSAPDANRTIHAEAPAVSMRTHIGGSVRIDILYGEGLPRIC